MDTPSTTTTTTGIDPTEDSFDLEAAIQEKMAKKRAQDLAFLRDQEEREARSVAECRRRANAWLEEAFSPQVRSALGMTLDEFSIEKEFSCPEVNLKIDGVAWTITLNSRVHNENAVRISGPNSNSVVVSGDATDQLLLMIGQWREEQAEQALRQREIEQQKSAEAMALQASMAPGKAEDAAESAPAATSGPRMVVTGGRKCVAFILSEALGDYDMRLCQTTAVFSGNNIHITLDTSALKQRTFSLSQAHLNALVEARDLYLAHLGAIEQARQDWQSELREDDIPF